MGVNMELPQQLEEVLLTEEEIVKRVGELGEQISREYSDKDLLLVGILKGSFVFMADLMRSISIPISIDFVGVSSYGSATKSSGVVRITKDLDESVEGKHVLVVEDIVDTGWTLRLSYIADNLRAKKAASVRICTLLDKPDRREADVNLDYVGFVIPNKFVVGYGLDYKGLYRNLPYVAVLKEEVNRR
jgi:hypoxanthine phosphoribosyltransferase